MAGSLKTSLEVAGIELKPALLTSRPPPWPIYREVISSQPEILYLSGIEHVSLNRIDRTETNATFTIDDSTINKFFAL